MPSDDPFDDIFEEFERLVEDLLGRGSDDEVRPIVTASGPKVEVNERADEVEVVADLPGVTADDVDLECDGELLYISAGGHERRVRLPVSVDETSADAAFKNSVLSVTFEPAERGGPTVDRS